MDSNSNSRSSYLGSPYSHYQNTHEALHKVEYELQIKLFQLSHAKIEITDKLLALQFQLSRVTDKVDALTSIVMELRISSKAQATIDTPMDDKGMSQIDLKQPIKDNDQ